jgi:hypothetical protein
MKMDTDSNSRGLTIIEVVVIIAGLIMLAAVALPMIDRPRRCGGPRITCANNLHQIAVAAKTWALDNQDHYPYQVSGTNGGAREDALRGFAAPVFEAMSNELNSTIALICPADVNRSSAPSFGPSLHNSNLSYFVSLDAIDDNPQMFFAGDRNLQSNGVPLRGGAMHRMVPTSTVGWTKELHNRIGNILLVDGSVQEWSGAALQSAVATGMNTNRIDVP